MNLIDVIILAWLVSAALRGYAVGLLRQGLSFSGFVLGLVAGGLLAPYISQPFDGSSRLLVAVMIAFLLAAALGGLGDGLALRLQAKIKPHLAHRANAVLGTLTGILFVLLSSWLIATTLTRLPFANISLAIEQSAIIQTVNKILPTPPALADQLGKLITPYSFPDVFVGPEPTQDPAGQPTTAEVEAAAAKAADSTVRIEGFACGNIVTGSGYVAAPTYVVTNAHVVAGVDRPIVLNQDQRQRAEVVWFDPVVDLAVLRTSGVLLGEPLPLTDGTLPRGTSLAVLGYPGGGALRVSPAVVLRSQFAVGRDIYGSAVSSRFIYALQTDVEQGNSGGPVVTADGEVAGVVFGEAVNDSIGYALTAEEIADDIAAALTRSAPVDSGHCL